MPSFSEAGGPQKMFLINNLTCPSPGKASPLTAGATGHLCEAGTSCASPHRERGPCCLLRASGLTWPSPRSSQAAHCLKGGSRGWGCKEHEDYLLCYRISSQMSTRARSLPGARSSGASWLGSLSALPDQKEAHGLASAGQRGFGTAPERSSCPVRLNH